jgi:hypothetical protein
VFRSVIFFLRSGESIDVLEIGIEESGLFMGFFSACFVRFDDS